MYLVWYSVYTKQLTIIPRRTYNHVLFGFNRSSFNGIKATSVSSISKLKFTFNVPPIFMCTFRNPSGSLTRRTRHTATHQFGIIRRHGAGTARLSGSQGEIIPFLLQYFMIPKGSFEKRANSLCHCSHTSRQAHKRLEFSLKFERYVQIIEE